MIKIGEKRAIIDSWTAQLIILIAFIVLIAITWRLLGLTMDSTWDSIKDFLRFGR